MWDQTAWKWEQRQGGSVRWWCQKVSEEDEENILFRPGFVAFIMFNLCFCPPLILLTTDSWGRNMRLFNCSPARLSVCHLVPDRECSGFIRAFLAENTWWKWGWWVCWDGTKTMSWQTWKLGGLQSQATILCGWVYHYKWCFSHGPQSFFRMLI